jgi:hypothetical protein
MSRIEDLIRAKQSDIDRLKREISALKIVAPMLNDEFVTAHPQDAHPAANLGMNANDIQ